MKKDSRMRPTYSGSKCTGRHTDEDSGPLIALLREARDVRDAGSRR